MNAFGVKNFVGSYVPVFDGSNDAKSEDSTAVTLGDVSTDFFEVSAGLSACLLPDLQEQIDTARKITNSV